MARLASRRKTAYDIHYVTCLEASEVCTLHVISLSGKLGPAARLLHGVRGGKTTALRGSDYWAQTGTAKSAGAMQSCHFRRANASSTFAGLHAMLLPA